jgi:hypothetical protein
MSQLRTHPIRTLGGLLVLALALFMLSASGQPGTYWEDGPEWLGAICWFAWLIVALVFLVAAGYSVVRSVTRNRTTS